MERQHNPQHKIGVKRRDLIAMRKRMFDLHESLDYWKLRALMAESVLRGGVDIKDAAAARETLRVKREQARWERRPSRGYGDGLQCRDTGPLVRRSGPRLVGGIQVLPDNPIEPGLDQEADTATAKVAKPRIRKRKKRGSHLRVPRGQGHNPA